MSAAICRMVYRRLTDNDYFWEGTFEEDGEDEGRPSDGEFHIFERSTVLVSSAASASPPSASQ